MKISYNWLKDYIDNPLTPEETADKLTLLGLEVEEIQQIGSDFKGFVVGEVLAVKPHPNADKLQICDVQIGDETVQIVCGAKNVASGQKVPVATVGSTLPVPMKDGTFLTIKKAKLRGETSNGMICSEAELGIGVDHSGIMVLDENYSAGQPFSEVIPNSKDWIFEIGLTPNRPDASCHIGVARDLSAVIEKSYSTPYQTMSDFKSNSESEISISIKDQEKCHRYVGVVVDNVSVKESPEWLKVKLMAIGLRPINNVVDVTNFVLHEIGQPLHAFDLNLITDKKIIVQSFQKETLFKTLDSIERKVPAGSLFICDGKGPVAIAGVMGGENSEVTSSTNKVLIESAWFEPSSIRKTSKALALQTDSSYRFERGIDPEIQLKAAMRAAKMIAELSGGTIQESFLDIHPVQTEVKKVSIRVSRVNRLLGTTLTFNTIKRILTDLEFQIESSDKETLLCEVPAFRPDISREVDLIEEVGRVFDYNNIPTPTTATFQTPEPLMPGEIFHQECKNLAKSLGYKEIMTNSLLSKKESLLLADESVHIDTLNPVSQENTTLRTGLMGGFLKAVEYNLNRSATNIRFFEVGHVFKKHDRHTWIKGVQEHSNLLMGLCGEKKPDDWRSDAIHYSIFDLKADLSAFILQLLGSKDFIIQTNDNHTLSYIWGDEIIATITIADDKLLKGFNVDKEVFIAEIDLTKVLEISQNLPDLKYTPIPKFPAFEFDAAFTVDSSTRSGELSHVIQQTAGEILKEISVFDVYEGENLGKGKKSIAFRLTFLDSNKTLNIKDVEPVVQKVVHKLEAQFNAKLRS
tara:strand:- start:20416 stop:22827 length:2412 start_codon:yes stop_codon:yes gene_type:complete